MNNGLEWHKLTKKTMPPEETPILLWLDYNNFGFPVCGCNTCGVITYASNSYGITELDHKSWRNTRWAMIEPPEGAVI